MTPPPDIAAAARARFAGEKKQRLNSEKAIDKGCLMNAEPDLKRKVRRISSIMKVGARDAAAIATYKTPAVIKMLPKSLGGSEKIQGSSEDFLGVAFLETAVAAAGSVARVAFTDRRPQGSGFMVSDRLFLTNHHVITSAADCQQFVLEFDFQLDYRGQPRNVTRFTLAPEMFFLTSPETDLDFTLVAVGRRADGGAQLAAYGYVPLLDRDDKHMLGELVNVVQHPEGNFKQAVIRENHLVARLDRVLHYVADTMPGSSGSPVFNDQWEAIALHHWGEPFTETVGPNGKPITYDANEGIRISAIVTKLREMRVQLGDNNMRALLDAVLQPKAEYPSKLSEVMTRTSSSSDEGAGSDKDGIKVRIDADGRATWTLPLQVSVQLGNFGAAPVPVAPTISAVPAAGSTPAEAEKIEVDQNYANRTGYNPKFLTGFTVPMPVLSTAQKKAAAKLRQTKKGQNPNELKYTHFSVVMNAARRLAFFTASNIDGASWRNIDRKTGLPKEAAEATENWFTDPRIDETAQCDQSLYDKQKPKRVFDRGHLVRRQDPSWGTDKIAMRADADTFHFANCTPQGVTFNESAKFWQGIEQYILEDNAVADQDKVCVFTGPVLTNQDRDFRTVKVPKKFWKIVVRVQDGKLLATALLADQSQFIQTLPESMESEAMEAWDDTTKVKEFLSSVTEIEKLTGLDFGKLRDHDTKPADEAIAQPLTSFEQIPLQPKAKAPRRSRKKRPR